MLTNGSNSVGQFPNKATQFSKENQPEGRGRPKGSLDIMTMVQRLLEEPDQLPKALEQVIKDRCGGKKRALDALFISLLLEGLQGDTKATQELLNRGYGKVADRLEGGDNPIPISGKFEIVLVKSKESTDA